MADKYVCGLCGKTHYELDEYLACVAKCGAELKAREEEKAKKKHLEEVNAALNGIKEAKKYYKDLLLKFEEKYPEEYKMNFGHLDTECDCGGSCGDSCKCKEDKDTTSKYFSYRKNNNNEPIMKAKINGKNVDPKKLFEDPETEFLAKLLGIID